MAGATPEATRRYAEHSALPRSAFRVVDGLSVSSIGLGTYLGDIDDDTDLLYLESVLEAVARGCNFIDTAVNYRCQRSERAVGAAIERLAEVDADVRDSLVIATKGGFVPFDGTPPTGREAARAYIARTFFETGICSPAEMTTNLQHCMAPGYLAHQIARSRENLGVETIDIYYIHNPEAELPEVGRQEFERRIRLAFELLERQVADGAIGRYGTATWNGYRADPHAGEHLSLERLSTIAREVGGENHHFRVIQLPFNLALPEAYASFNQRVGDEWLSTLRAADALGISVVASASLMQSRLAGELPDEVLEVFDLPTNAQRAIQFARSAPGVASALVGMARPSHVRDNLGLLEVEPSAAATIRELFDDD